MSQVKEIPGQPAVVLVHGAFADGSGWTGGHRAPPGQGRPGNGAGQSAPRPHLRRRVAHHVLTGGVGHNPPQEAPRAFAEAVVQVDRF